MPFQKGNTIGQDTRFKKGQSGNPAGRPPDKLRRFINAELDKIGREATDKQEAATKLQVLAERIVDDAISGASRVVRCWWIVFIPLSVDMRSPVRMARRCGFHFRWKPQRKNCKRC